MTRRLLLLAPAGMLLGHLVGYALTGAAQPVDHSHLPAVAAVAVPGAALALLAALAGLGRRVRSAVGPLVAAQSVLFLGMESFERAGAFDAALSDAPVVIGVAAQVLAALLLLAAERWFRGVGAAIAASMGRPWSMRPPRRIAVASRDLPAAGRWTAARRPLTRRGPPLLVNA